MSIECQPLAGDIWVIEVSGRLDHSQTPQLESEINQLLDQDHTRLLVDLAGVTYINSGGMRALVTVWRRANQLGGDVVLCCLDPKISQVFMIVGFDKVFRIATTRAAAKRALANS